MKNLITVNTIDGKIIVIMQPYYYFELKDTPANQKILYIILRLIKYKLDDDHSPRNILTFQKISDFFGFKHRQNSENYFRDFKSCGEDMEDYLNRKQKLEDSFPLIEKQILQFPFLKISEHYRIFQEEHPEFKMSETTFRNYASQIDALKLKKRYDKFLEVEKGSLNNNFLLKELLEQETLSDVSKKVIISHFKIEDNSHIKKEKADNFLMNLDVYGSALLVSFLIACGMNYFPLSILLGVSKATIHNLFYSLPDLGNLIRGSIVKWSGTISIDEKWIWIGNKWFYALTIVDNETGFPLYIKLFPTITSESWQIFMRGFKSIYGNPVLIISDGSKALAKARNIVFANVPYQLCKFHKLKNLYRRIHENTNDPKLRKKLFRLAKNIFRNSSVSSRKKVAQRMVEMNIPGVSDYVRKNILGDWKHLTKGFTSNASERWNRKITKVTAKRYGLKSEKFVISLLNSLWMKEAFFNQAHLSQSFITEVDLPKICQKNLKTANIIEFFKKKVAKQYQNKCVNF
ncbi:MAG: transposase [Candidatus Cloacimonetes bacterium]|nr:transposase [Candidatus Cloacimonadota bacterium]